ncbi:MAG: hypothetical protein LBS01_05820 [Prevotellaceae bacterium]|jgi:hypothetical protein|nr:hypothetical protein [Prevotellaceae bacterium]
MKTKKILSIIIILFSICNVNAQVAINTEVPSPNSALHITAPNSDKGVILPQAPSDVSLGDVVLNGLDALGDPFDADGLTLYNMQTGCFNYYKVSSSSWYSLCGTPPPAVGTIECTSITAVGVYIEDQVFGINNYLQVKIDVTSPGTYSITASTSENNGNGYYFSTNGTFPRTGTYTVNIQGAGMPDVAGTNIIKFVFNGMEQTCDFPLEIKEGTPDFCIIGAKQIPSTPWPINQEFNPNYYAEVTLQVNKPGPYTITTSEINGYDFSGTGQLSQASGYNPNGNFPQTVMVNIPVVAGKKATSNSPHTNTFQVTSVGANLCNTVYPLTITLAEVAFSIDCQAITLGNFGTLKQGVAIPDGSVITLPVTASTGGTTQITANFAGLSFSTGAAGSPGEVTLNSGPNTVTLYPVTLGQKPNQAGEFPINIASSKGGYEKCAYPKLVTVAPATASFRNISITTFSNQNQYIMNPFPGGVDAPCDMVLSVQVDMAGEYNLTTTVNGVTWSGQGNVNAGNSTITLKPVDPATNRPASSGPKSVSLSYTGPSGSSVTNSQTVYFVQRSMNILFLGGDPYSGYSATYNARKLWSSANNFGPNGTVGVQSLKAFNGGTTPSTSTLRNLINNNKIDIIVVGYNYQPNQEGDRQILANFVNNKGGALIFSSELYPNYAQDLINKICGVTLPLGLGGGGNSYINTVESIDDPVTNGKFGDLRGKAIGNDVANAMPVQQPTVSAPLKSLIKVQSTGNVWAFRHETKGFLYICDSGWLAGHPTASVSSTTIYPLQINSDNTPKEKPYSGGNMVQNSFLFGNALAWAIDWAAANCNTSAIIP